MAAIDNGDDTLVDADLLRQMLLDDGMSVDSDPPAPCTPDYDAAIFDSGKDLWQWTILPGHCSRIHVNDPPQAGTVFPCIRVGAKGEGGTNIEDAMRIAAVMNRRYCDKCWLRLSPTARAGLEQRTIRFV